MYQVNVIDAVQSKSVYNHRCIFDENEARNVMDVGFGENTLIWPTFEFELCQIRMIKIVTIIRWSENTAGATYNAVGCETAGYGRWIHIICQLYKH